MKKMIFSLLLVSAVAVSSQQPTAKSNADVSRPFSSHELMEFTALNPIDTHVHGYNADPAVFALLQKLNLHILDITVYDESEPMLHGLTASEEHKDAWEFVHGSQGRAAYCSTFDASKLYQPGFAQEAIREINQDFAQGAVAVKIWKNIGMEILNAKGNFVMPDDPAFEPIYKDIAAHHKTLVAHLADPNTAWLPPNTVTNDSDYFQKNPKWYMYNKPHPGSKAQIIRARDHILEENPTLRMVGAHLGSLEDDFPDLGRHFERYPNFAVDLAGRVKNMMAQPRADMIAFVTKYQDRLIYATDNQFFPGDSPRKLGGWAEGYARDWRYFATDETVVYRGHATQGLALPPSILHKIYHDNAVHWFPGILAAH